MLNAKLRPHGCIHPISRKELTSDHPIEAIAQPNKLVLLLQQHSGAPALPIVKVGDKVAAYQMIAKPNGRMSVPVHAPLAGEVVSIVQEPKPAITIKVSKEQVSAKPLQKLEELPERDALLALIDHAGIVGMGGAMFPAADKLRMSSRHKIETLIINGSECEPYLTVDDRLMQEQGEQLLGGIRVIQQITRAKQVYIGIENNKPEALARMDSICTGEANIDVVSLPALYPMGSAKQMIEAITGEQIPQGKRSTEMGVLVQNVGTSIAIFNAVRFGRPLTHRVITVSGGAIERPTNLLVPIGTTVAEIISHCGGLKNKPARMVLGGPMMGKAFTDLQEPITKGTSGVLLLNEEELPSPHASACVRCGRCVDACPMSLSPLEMVAELKIDKFDNARDLGVNECLLCGSCSYVCPAAIPLTEYFDWGQQELYRQKMAEQKTKRTCVNSAARRERLEQEAAEKEAAKAAKAATQTARRSGRRTAVVEEKAS